MPNHKRYIFVRCGRNPRFLVLRTEQYDRFRGLSIARISSLVKEN